MMIREATVWDATKIVDMWARMISEVEHMQNPAPDPENFYLSILVAIKNPDSLVLVSEDDNGKITGFISGFITKAEYSDKLVCICDNSFVYPEYRGKKLYFELIEEGKKRVMEMGVKVMKFQFRYEPRMVKVWERFGFKPSYLVYEKEVE